MSGKRQHYLPRFLQRGFATSEGTERTWMYRRNMGPRQVGLADVGVERGFYSDAEGSAVDETITDAESNEFSEAARSARAANPGTALDARRYARLFAHLEVRTRHIRQAFLARSEELWSKTMQRFKAPGLAETLLQKRWQRNPEMLETTVRETLCEKGLPQELTHRLTQELKIRLPAFAKELGLVWPLLVRSIKPRIQRALQDGIKRGHVSALAKSISPECRIERYQRLTFRVLEIEHRELILGDSASVFQSDSSNGLKPFVDKDDNLLATVLPISSARIILGISDGHNFEQDLLPGGIASCAFDFFIASADSADNRELAKKIGTKSLPLSDEEIDALIDEAFEKELN